MYRALIVDDEDDVREGLQLLMNWEEYGFKVVGEARNGADALEKMALLNPDAVLTDIRMPVLDGLEYIRRVREQFPHTLISIISAFGEFEYAREAIRLGVVDFMLKPITKDALGNALTRMKAVLDQQVREKGRAREHRLLIREKLLQDLCHGKALTARDMEMVEGLIPCGRPYEYQLVLIEMDEYHTYICRDTEHELELKRFMIRNITEELAAPWPFHQVYEDSQERIGLLLGSAGKPPLPVEQLCMNIRESLKRYVRIPVSIGIGKPCSDLKDISKSRNEALAALEYMLLEGKGILLSYAELEQRYARAANQPNAAAGYFDRLTQAIDEGNGDGAKEELKRFFDEAKRFAAPEWFRGLCLELIMELVKLVRNAGGDVRLIFGERLQEYEAVFMKRSFAEVYAWVESLCLKTLNYLKELRSAKLPDVAEEVKQYIEKHYHEDISLKIIATKVYKNPVYLGQLFKAAYGESFSSYLTRVRIEKAKELLRSDKFKVYEIAEKVGYYTLDTFYQRFKQLTGMNPTEYKQRCKGNVSSMR